MQPQATKGRYDKTMPKKYKWLLRVNTGAGGAKSKFVNFWRSVQATEVGRYQPGQLQVSSWSASYRIRGEQGNQKVSCLSL